MDLKQLIEAIEAQNYPKSQVHEQRIRNVTDATVSMARTIFKNVPRCSPRTHAIRLLLESLNYARQAIAQDRVHESLMVSVDRRRQLLSQFKGKKQDREDLALALGLTRLPMSKDDIEVADTSSSGDEQDESHAPNAPDNRPVSSTA